MSKRTLPSSIPSGSKKAKAVVNKQAEGTAAQSLLLIQEDVDIVGEATSETFSLESSAGSFIPPPRPQQLLRPRVATSHSSELPQLSQHELVAVRELMATRQGLQAVSSAAAPSAFPFSRAVEPTVADMELMNPLAGPASSLLRLYSECLYPFLLCWLVESPLVVPLLLAIWLCPAVTCLVVVASALSFSFSLLERGGGGGGERRWS
jgi:hypothetical protein